MTCRIIIRPEENRGDERIIAHSLREGLREQNRCGIRQDETPVPELTVVRPDCGEVPFGQPDAGVCFVRRGHREIQVVALDDSVLDLA